MKLGTTTLSVTTAGRPRQQATGGGGGGGGSGSALTNDLAYDGFFSQNKSALDFSNSSYNSFSSSTSTHNSLDTFIDHNSSRLYGAYNTAHYYTWANAGQAYSGFGGFYSVGTRSDFAGQQASYLGNTGRGITIAYLGDQTPVIVIGRSGGSNRLDFYSYPGTAHLGYMTVRVGGGGSGYNPGSNNDMSGIAFDGTNLLMMNRNQSYMWAYPMPADTSAINNGVMDTVAQWSMPTTLQYGLAWTGDGVIMGKGGSPTEVAYVRLSGSGFTGTGTAIRSYSMGSNNYSLAIDYKNRKLVVGGYSNNLYKVFSE